MALALGMTVEQLMNTMSSIEYSYWLALDGIEPVGATRGDWQAALVARTIAETERSPKSRPEPYEIRDFVLFRPPDSEEEDEDRVAEKLLAMFPPRGGN